MIDVGIAIGVGVPCVLALWASFAFWRACVRPDEVVGWWSARGVSDPVDDDEALVRGLRIVLGVVVVLLGFVTGAVVAFVGAV